MNGDAGAAKTSEALERVRIAQAVVDASARALNLLGELDRQRAVDVDVVYEAARVRTVGLVRVLGDAHGHALMLSRADGQSRAGRQMALALAHSVAVVRGQAKSLVHAIADERRRRKTAAELQASRLGWERGLPEAKVLSFDAGRWVNPWVVVGDLRSALGELIERAQRVAATQDSALDMHSTPAVARTAVRLVGLAAGFAPPDERARYAEEYAGELWEISEAGASRREQLAHAFRVLLKAPGVRAPEWRRDLAGGAP
jgi:hypothetical protein